MAKSVKLKAIKQSHDRWYIRFGKSEIEIEGGTKADLRQWIRSQLDESDEMTLAIVLAAWLKQDPQINNPEMIVGKTLTLDLTGNLQSVDGIVRVSNG